MAEEMVADDVLELALSGSAANEGEVPVEELVAECGDDKGVMS